MALLGQDKRLRCFSTNAVIILALLRFRRFETERFVKGLDIMRALSLVFNRFNQTVMGMALDWRKYLRRKYASPETK